METKEGYKKTKIGWVPDDWGIVKFGEVSNNFDSKRVPIKAGDRQGLQGEYPYFGAQGIIDHINDYIFDGQYLLIAEDGENVKSRKNDIAFIVNGKFWVNNHAHIVQANSESNIHFLKYFLNSISISEYVTGMAQPKLNKSKLNSILVSLPPLPEQQKIADILSTVDDKISSIENQIQQTEQLKKGLMAKLLTEGIGHTEFKDTKIGRVPKSWDVVQVSEICDTTSGGTPNRSIENYWNGSIPWVKTGEIQYNLITTTDETITESGLKNSSAKIVPEGSIIMAMYGQGKTRGKVAILGIEASLNQACLAIICKEKIYNTYLYHHFYSNYEKMRSVSQEGSQKNLSATLIKEMRVALPPIQEQKQIASILSTVDDKLDVLHNKKSSYSTLKKGLMAKLLTGQMRVKL